MPVCAHSWSEACKLCSPGGELQRQLDAAVALLREWYEWADGGDFTEPPIWLELATKAIIDKPVP